MARRHLSTKQAGYRWSEALFLSGNPSDPSFQQRLGKLSKVLKD